jgi:phosphoserine phosphatase RsbU/P
MFMTFCYLIVNLDDHTISYCNAGHNYPYHYRNDSKRLESLESGTHPMGISEKLPCGKDTVEWSDGDILALYIDGITEAENSEGEEFGVERLESLIINNTNSSASELRDHIIHELNKHCQGDAYKDDITLMIVKLGKGE